MKKDFINISCHGWDEYFLTASSPVNDVKGSFVEMGFGLGDSANVFIKLMNNNQITKRDLWLCDSFKGFINF